MPAQRAVFIRESRLVEVHKDAPPGLERASARCVGAGVHAEEALGHLAADIAGGEKDEFLSFRVERLHRPGVRPREFDGRLQNALVDRTEVFFGDEPGGEAVQNPHAAQLFRERLSGQFRLRTLEAAGVCG